MENILEVSNLSKSYENGSSNEVNVLKHINVNVKKGEFVAIMGPSGSGKSSLLYTVSGMDGLTSGHVLLDGKELSKMDQDTLANIRLEKMGFIFQQSHLLKNLSVLENIMLSAVLNGKEKKSIIRKRALSLLEQTGISELADREITQASGGQLQRVGVCRALINNPQIIFADEPTGALNKKASEEIMTLLLEINQKGTTIVLVTHDVKVSAKCERILFMSDGKVVDECYLGKYNESNKQEEREQIIFHRMKRLGI